MAKCEDMTGRRFGMLTVVSRAENGKYGDAMWQCQCDCGGTVIVRAGDLRRGSTKSCKCMKREWNRESHTTHGLSNTRLHKIWSMVIERCNNHNHVQYHRYGGRGIKMCEEWEKDFVAFYEWAMANGYEDGLTLDREDNDKGYSPDNCRWITMREQQHNRSNNHLVTMNGRTQNVTQWCNELGVNRAYVYKRLKKGWSPEKAFFYHKA